MRIAISSTEDSMVRKRRCTTREQLRTLIYNPKGTSIDISDREPVTHVRWWMSRTEIDTVAYFVDIKGVRPSELVESSCTAHTSSTLVTDVRTSFSFALTNYTVNSTLSSPSLSQYHRLYITITTTTTTTHNKFRFGENRKTRTVPQT